MTKINVEFPSTNVDILNKVAQEYLELRVHEFKHVMSKIIDSDNCHFSNDYKFHQYHNLASLNLIISYQYHKDKLIKECISFHGLDDKLVTIDDLVFLDDIKTLIDANTNDFDYNNFYISQAGINFIYIVNNQTKETLIENKYINYKINV